MRKCTYLGQVIKKEHFRSVRAFHPTQEEHGHEGLGGARVVGGLGGGGHGHHGQAGGQGDEVAGELAGDGGAGGRVAAVAHVGAGQGGLSRILRVSKCLLFVAFCTQVVTNLDYTNVIFVAG